MTRLQDQLTRERLTHTSELTTMEETAGKRLQQAHQELQQANSRVDDLQRETSELRAAAEDSSQSRVNDHLEELRQER